MAHRFNYPPDFRIISGGQTGADLAALDLALALAIPHGGWCPKGRESEDGPIPPTYLLTETPRKAYLERTEWNVRDSDATVIFTMSNALDGGSGRTVQFAEKLGRPWLHFRPGVHEKYLVQFLERHRVVTLNVAGKRESAAPGIGQFVRETLGSVLTPPSAAGLTA